VRLRPSVAADYAGALAAASMMIRVVQGP
jgi:hypothetical protein